ncbi:DUF2637 domain-containing protein [Streptomyces cyaneofuscatus]|uniref:DUF2637 domain-containing protein n=1 Tax=Streptomyces cyaneofuscatus TaxID=66883 RepID=UPI0007C68025|nr:DUF2637 domain-containing protein [Streptomyces cyaneofuscatus]
MPVRPRPDAQLGLTVSAAVLTTALTAVSFWLSFEALHDLAVAHRLKGERAWAWPATVDLFIVIGELLILRASLLRRVDPWAIVLTAAGSIGSIVLNIASVSGEKTVFLDYVVAAVPPVAALLAFGVLMRQVHEYLASRQQVLTAPPVPSAPPVTAPVEPEVPADEAPVEEPVVTEEPEPVKEPEKNPEPLTQPQQIDAVIRGLYDSLGQRRPTTALMTDALEKAELPSSDATARTARKRVEAAEPHLKTLPSALAA